jgi:hypothetical protein
MLVRRLAKTLYLVAFLIFVSACGTGSSADDENSSLSAGTTILEHVDCTALPAPSGNIRTVTPAQVSQLSGIVSGASPGDTILLEDGTYNLNGSVLWISTPGITIRSASGNPENVILDGGYDSTEIITVTASDVTVAEITVKRAFTHAIHVTSSSLGDTDNTLIYRVNLIDPREQTIKINPHANGFYADNGVVACSTLQLTDQGRPNVNPTISGCYTGGIDAHQARGWIVRDNFMEGFWCASGLAEHAIHFWRGGRDTVIERNVLKDNARGIGLGLVNSGAARTFSDNFCPEAGGAYIGHYGGIIRNNFIHASSPGLLGSNDGFDCGICLASACKAVTVHNSVVSTGNNFSSIEWRFGGSVGNEIRNNIATHGLRARDGGSASLSGNLEGASLSLFVDGQGGDLHLAPGANAAIDQGVPLAPGVSDNDIDDDIRDANPDIGADEI